MQLGEGGCVIEYVFEYLAGDDLVERVVPEREVDTVALHRGEEARRIDLAVLGHQNTRAEHAFELGS